MVWSVSVNQHQWVWFPSSSLQGSLLAVLGAEDGWLHAQVGKAEEGECSLPACSPESMEGTSIPSGSKHSCNYSNNSLCIGTHTSSKGTNDFRLLVLGFVASSLSLPCSAAAVPSVRFPEAQIWGFRSEIKRQNCISTPGEAAFSQKFSQPDKPVWDAQGMARSWCWFGCDIKVPWILVYQKRS